MKMLRSFSILTRRPGSLFARPRGSVGVNTVATPIKASGSSFQAAIIEFTNDQQPGEGLPAYFKRSENDLIASIREMTQDLEESGGVLLAAIQTVFNKVSNKSGEVDYYFPNDTTHCFGAVADTSLASLFDPDTIVDFYPQTSSIRNKGDSLLATMTLKEQEYSAPGKHGKNPARIKRLLSDPTKSKQKTGAHLVGIFLPYSVLGIDTEGIRHQVTSKVRRRKVYDRMKSSCAHALNDLKPGEYSNEEPGLLPIDAMVDVAASLCKCDHLSDLIRSSVRESFSSSVTPEVEYNHRP